MTSSTGWSGFTFRGSPPSRTTPSRIAARSTTAGTPVKSWSSTRPGMKAISFWAFDVRSHPARVWMSSRSTNRPSSRRSRFSRRILSEYGSRDSPPKPARSRAGRLKIWNVSPPTRSGARVWKEFCETILRSSLTLPCAFKPRQECACDGGRILTAGVDGVIQLAHVLDRDAAGEAVERRANPGIAQQHRASGHRCRIVWRKVPSIVGEHRQIVRGDQPARGVSRDQIDLSLRQRTIDEREIHRARRRREAEAIFRREAGIAIRALQEFVAEPRLPRAGPDRRVLDRR